MKDKENIILVIGGLLAIIIVCLFIYFLFQLDSKSEYNPTKPFIIIEKSFRYLDENDKKIIVYQYVYISKNNIQRKFEEINNLYKIGDTIK